MHVFVCVRVYGPRLRHTCAPQAAAAAATTLAAAATAALAKPPAALAPGTASSGTASSAAGGSGADGVVLQWLQQGATEQDPLAAAQQLQAFLLQYMSQYDVATDARIQAASAKLQVGRAVPCPSSATGKPASQLYGAHMLLALVSHRES